MLATLYNSVILREQGPISWSDSQIDPLQLNRSLSHEKVHRMGKIFVAVCYRPCIVVKILEVIL
jgi:hypothetical protein